MEQLPTFTSVSPSKPSQSEQGNRLRNATVQSGLKADNSSPISSQNTSQQAKLAEDNKKSSEFALQFLALNSKPQVENASSLPKPLPINPVSSEEESTGKDLSEAEGIAGGQVLPLENPGLPQSMILKDSQDSLKDILFRQNSGLADITQLNRSKAQSLPLSLKQISSGSETLSEQNVPQLLANSKEVKAQSNINLLTIAADQTVNGFLSQSQLLKLMTDKNSGLELRANSEFSKVDELLGSKAGLDNVLRTETGNPLSRTVEQVGVYSNIGDSRYNQTDSLDSSGKPAAMAAVKQDLDSPMWGKEFSNRIMWMAKNKMHTAQLRVDPPNLGAIDIKITVNQDQATVSFVSNQAVVRDAIESASIRLKEQFAENGFQSVDVDVSSGEEKSRQQDKIEELPMSLAAQSAEEVQEDEITLSTTTLIQKSSMVDYFV